MSQAPDQIEYINRETGEREIEVVYGGNELHQLYHLWWGVALRPLLVRPRLDGSEHLNEVHGAYMLSLSSRRVFFSGISKRVWRLSSVSLRCPLGRFTGCLLY